MAHNQAWHSRSIKEVLALLHASPAGLTNHAVRERQHKYGLNRVELPHRSSLWKLFFSQFTSPLVYILLISAALTAYLHLGIDTFVILFVVGLNAIIGFLQERKAEASLQSLRETLEPQARAVRNGKTISLMASELVPGDIVELAEGARIPADLRLIQTHNFSVDESVLSGESMPVEKHTRPLSNNTSSFKRYNLAFSGTMAVRGRAIGVVVTTGLHTEFADVVRSTFDTLEETTPLDQQIHVLSRQLLIVVLGLVALLGIIGLLQGREPLQLLLTSVATAVSALPEGLPAVITVVLAIGVKRMADEKAIVRRLAVIETLGSTTVIASDKTGTLTENRLKAVSFHLPGNSLLRLDQHQSTVAPKLRHLLEISVLASDAQTGDRLSDPIERALLAATELIGIPPHTVRERYQRTSEIPFQSEHRFMAVAYQGDSAKRFVVAFKGSLETTLKHAQHILTASGLKSLTPKLRSQIMEQGHLVARDGFRILAIAEGTTSEKTLRLNHIPRLTYLGFVAFADPARPEAITAIQHARRAGIRVMMLTGDIASTAEAIARDIGLLKKNEAAVTASELSSMTLPEFERTIESQAVFAEIPPQVKLQIVEALQKNGEIVAVTGDGANDAPIIKRAHVGIAMGAGGTDIARSVADLVLADNNFRTIVTAIEHGRLIFYNLRRVVAYLLATNFGELLVVVIAICSGLPLPLLPTQILWVNVVTEGIGTIGLALEPKHQDLLEQPPRPAGEPLVTPALYRQIGILALAIATVVLGIFIYDYTSSGSLDHARTVTFVTLSLMQLSLLFSARSSRKPLLTMSPLSNPLLLVTFTVSMMTTFATIFWNPLRELFHFVPLGATDWLVIFVGIVVLNILAETIKFARNFGLGNRKSA